ncbi:MAG: hypothetical protein ISS77_07175 [Phycisphaerae bacterium]|nr:hypothetical protein [Phycisphaerae bacterium]
MQTPKENDRCFEFLRNEYSFLAEYIKVNIEERDRYLKFYIAILAGMAAVASLAIEKDNIGILMPLAIVNTFLSLFVLPKVVYQRVVITEYKNRLNLVRGEMCQFAGCRAGIQAILLPTDASLRYHRWSGGDAAMVRMLEIVTSASATTSAFLWTLHRSPPVLLSWSQMALIFISALVLLEVLWQVILAFRDAKTQREHEKRTTHAQPSAQPDG